MLKEDNIRRANLGFTFNAYGMDLTEYMFEDWYVYIIIYLYSV